jgi:hypothetical protein
MLKICVGGNTVGDTTTYTISNASNANAILYNPFTTEPNILKFDITPSDSVIGYKFHLIYPHSYSGTLNFPSSCKYYSNPDDYTGVTSTTLPSNSITSWLLSVTSVYSGTNDSASYGWYRLT